MLPSSLCMEHSEQAACRQRVCEWLVQSDGSTVRLPFEVMEVFGSRIEVISALAATQQHALNS